jgi:hypothetical protein
VLFFVLQNFPSGDKGWGDICIGKREVGGHFFYEIIVLLRSPALPGDEHTRVCMFARASLPVGVFLGNFGF